MQRLLWSLCNAIGAAAAAGGPAVFESVVRTGGFAVTVVVVVAVAVVVVRAVAVLVAVAVVVAVAVTVAVGGVPASGGFAVTVVGGSVTVTPGMITVFTTCRGSPLTVFVAVRPATCSGSGVTVTVGVTVGRLCGTYATSVVYAGPEPPPAIADAPIAIPPIRAATTAVVDQARRSGSRVIRGSPGRLAKVSEKRDEPGDRRDRTSGSWDLGRKGEGVSAAEDRPGDRLSSNIARKGDSDHGVRSDCC
ncbi:hypothetical protein GCM10009742_19030 [Kribbella karoonensis]|uniref:Uncharacterized protein n=1 Tax=Kribbella karoonensis TaxID=324851 RepID=A0ABN2DE85_9ACTN